MFLNNLYVCPFIITTIIAKSQFENLTFSKMIFMGISRLKRTTPLQITDKTKETCGTVKMYSGFAYQIFFDFSLTVKAAPHECVLGTSQPKT